MKKVHIFYDRHFHVGRVNKRFAGSFVEHLNRCVYGGLHEPAHPSADENGFRGDLKPLIRESGVKLIRYPGGNFVSGYHWKDGIGPRELRPRRFDAAWQTIETNQIGTDEVARYLRELDIELMMSVNLGTGTPEEAAELVEYCNLSGGTQWSERRKENGENNPYGVRLWCVGNEMDGPWQLGQLNAEDYAKKYIAAARLMRRVDPSIELVACGSCSNEPDHTSFGGWDQAVLDAAYEDIDYLSLHRYYGYDVEQTLLYPRVDTLADIPAMPDDLDAVLKTIKGAIALARGKRRSRHSVAISFDELSVLPHDGKLKNGISVNEYRLADAVLYGALLCTMLCHADSVKINCQSLIVNENGMFVTLPIGGVIPQTILYPFRDIARHADGMALRPCCEGSKIKTPHAGEASMVATACIWNETKGTVTVFAANLNLEEDVEVTLCLRSFGELHFVEHYGLADDDPLARNTVNHPNAVSPQQFNPPVFKDGEGLLRLPKHSWHMLRFAIQNT